MHGKKSRFVAYFCCILSCHSGYAHSCAVTYQLSPGRFGDCVIMYCKAKYYAVKYDMPLLYKPFTLSDELALHAREPLWSQERENEFKQKKRVTCARDIDSHQSETLFIVDLFTTFADAAPQIVHKKWEPIDHWINLFADDVYAMMQQDSVYKKAIKEMLQPIRLINAPDLPKGYITVAVHVRTGSGYDGTLWSKPLYTTMKRTTQKAVPVDCWIADCACPLRFPPLQFYIQQIHALAHLFHEYPLYVQIFTDDIHPQDIFNTMQQQCPDNVTLALGTVGAWNARTLDDMYVMGKFDCLIRPCSFFSGVSQVVGNHKIVIRPDDFCFDDQTLYITDMMYTIHNNGRTERIRVPYEMLDAAHLQRYVRALLLQNR